MRIRGGNGINGLQSAPGSDLWDDNGICAYKNAMADAHKMWQWHQWPADAHIHTRGDNGINGENGLKMHPEVTSEAKMASMAAIAIPS